MCIRFERGDSRSCPGAAVTALPAWNGLVKPYGSSGQTYCR